jgi:hypothetical protein
MERCHQRHRRGRCVAVKRSRRWIHSDTMVQVLLMRSILVHTSWSKKRLAGTKKTANTILLQLVSRMLWRRGSL